MDEINRHDYKEYAYLHQLPIDKLLELLAVAPALSDRPEDEAYMSALEEAIIEKEYENPTGFFPDVDQQWEQFMTHYLPNIEDIALEPERTEHAISAQVNQQPLEVPPKRVVRFRRVWRTALVAAAAVVCVFGIMLTAQAAGIDVFGAMARWTEDVFSFGPIASDSGVSDNPTQETAGQKTEAPDTEFASLQEAFDAYGITEVHEPTWLPDGYALEELDVTNQNNPAFVAFSATYADGDDGIGIDVMSYEGEPSMQVQKIDAPVGTIEKDGVTFFLVENTCSYIVAWHDSQHEYYISGNLSKSILLEIAISMYD